MVKKFEVVTIGGATEDIAFYTNDGSIVKNPGDILRQELICFEYGAKINVDRSFISYGGGAANSAVCFSKLGFNTACIVAIGYDNIGENIANNLKKQKIDIELIQKIKNQTSGLSFILVSKNNDRIIFSNRAANSHLSIKAHDLNKIKNSKWVYVSSLSGGWKNDVKKIFSVPKINIAWNPGHFQLGDGYKAMGPYLKKVKVLLLNKDEALELVLSNPSYRVKPNKFLNSELNLLKIIKSWGPKIVVITNGVNGAHAYDGNKVYKQAVYKPKKMVDKTGVGDAFGASFVAGLELYKENITKALDLSAKNAALVVSEQGAQNGLLKLNK